AGILRDKSFTKLEPKNLEIVLDVHLKGAFYVTQPAFRVMKENNYGRIVMASSSPSRARRTTSSATRSRRSRRPGSPKHYSDRWRRSSAPTT
ncbi:MAG: SDR family NAD(P)-dependent oxidoreductase, partial [Deltaproteobacteria bacterium]|nr:SDR family NAD(P)-dependent oxidoreductase [Deltaproteobacteria bacterium]